MHNTMTINDLRNKRSALWEQAKTFLDTHRRDDGMLSAEDAATFEKMEDDVVNLGKEIDRMNRRGKLDAELAKPVGSPLTSRPGNGLLDDKTGRASDEYRKAMVDSFRSGFRRVSDVLMEGDDASGGYLVPAEWDSRLIEKLDEENIMRKLGTAITTSGERKINIAASKPAASWVEENGDLKFSDATFSQVILDAFKLSVAIKVSEELLSDNAFDLENFLINSFARAIGNAEEEAFLVGDGVSKPTGVLNATGGGETGVTTAKPNAVTADEILDLIYKLKRPYRTKASFITSDSTLAAIRKLKDGNGQYLWQPAVTAGEPDRLLGYPVLTSQFVPALAADQPVLAFGDFSYYNIGDRGVRSVARLNELFAGNGQIGFVSKERVDGKIVLPEAVQVMRTAAK